MLGKLRQMCSLVEKMEEVVKREVAFVEEFPLETLMEEDAIVYLREVDELVASQVCDVCVCMCVCVCVCACVCVCVCVHITCHVMICLFACCIPSLPTVTSTHPPLPPRTSWVS